MDQRNFINRSILFIAATLLLTPILAAAASDAGTLFVGKLVISNLPITPCVWIDYGYKSGPTFGSYSPTGLTGGKTVDEIDDTTACSGTYLDSLVLISGFSADPGKTWLTSVTCNGVTNDSSSASSYTYTSGEATWEWTQSFGLPAKVGNNVTCTVVHS